MLQPSDSHERRRRRRTLIAAGLLALTSIVLYALILPLRSDLEFGVGGPAYLVLVAPRGVVRTFPVPHYVSGAVRYQYDSQDGPAPARITLLFDAAEQPTKVVSWYSQRGGALGYRCVPGTSQLSCIAPGYAISVQATSVADGASVVVTFEEGV